MARIEPLEITDAPEKSRPLLEAVQKQLGFVPNIYKAVSHAPSVLDGLLGLGQKLGGGSLSPKLREQLALAVAGINICDYCASAHTAIGTKLGLSEDEISKNLRGDSDDPATVAALGFARSISDRRGHVSDEQVQAMRDAGFSDQQIVEVFAQTLMNIFTNYFNHLAQTEIDFPLVQTGQPQAV